MTVGNVTKERDEAFCNWLAGFTDGEGSFLIACTNGCHYAPRFVIRLREDDAPILREIHERLGVGSVARFYPPSIQKDGRSPQIALQVSNRRDCLELVKVFDKHPLRAKKAKDYAVWREAVLQSYADLRDPKRLEFLKRRLEAGRRFEPEDLEAVEQIPHPSLFDAGKVA